MKLLTDYELHRLFDEYIDSESRSHTVTILGYQFEKSDILKQCDLEIYDDEFQKWLTLAQGETIWITATGEYTDQELPID